MEYGIPTNTVSLTTRNLPRPLRSFVLAFSHTRTTIQNSAGVAPRPQEENAGARGASDAAARGWARDQSARLRKQQQQSMVEDGIDRIGQQGLGVGTGTTAGAETGARNSDGDRGEGLHSHVEALSSSSEEEACLLGEHGEVRAYCCTYLR